MTAIPLSRRAVATALLLAGMIFVGLAATTLSIDRVLSEERARDRQAVTVVGERLSAALRATVASLRGVDGLAVDGEVSAEEFAAFSEGVLPGSLYSALSFAEPVSGAEREAWEAQVGVPMIDNDGAGGFRPAAGRAEYIVVRHVEPSTEASRQVLGFDFLGDDVRGQAVREALSVDDPLVAGPLRLATNATPGVFVVNSVHAPDGSVIGVVGSGVGSAALFARLEGLDVEPVAISMDGRPLAGSSTGGATASFELGGRTFEVRSGHPAEPNWLLPVVLGLGTAMLAVAAVLGVLHETRDRRLQRWIANRNEDLAVLAERLASAPTADAIVNVVRADARFLVGADFASVGQRDPSDPTKLIVIHDAAMPDDVAEEYGVQEIDVEMPLTDCARTAEMIVLPEHRDCRQRYPHLFDGRTGIQAVVCVPLSLGSEATVGAVGFAWNRPLPRGRRDDIAATSQLVGQMIGRALERTLLREVVQHRVDALGAFARALGTARTTADISRIVAERLPGVLDVRAATLSIAPVAGNPLIRSYPPQSPDGEHLNLELHGEGAWNAATESLTQAVLEFLEGAWTRATLYDHERSVLERLQSTLLGEPPLVEGLRIAVAYRSAVEGVGIGGDWYSVIENGDTIYAVIGDIAGHGPGAVAIMAEVKTVIRHLLAAGATPEDVIEHAHEALMRRRAMASAVIVSVDVRTDRLTYVNAGHPYPAVISGGSGVALVDTHRPWLGVPSPTAKASSAPFPVGSTLLLYTDGLVEERNVPIDRSIDELVRRVERRVSDPALRSDPSSLVDALLAHRVDHRTQYTVDDDIAIIAIQRTP